MTEIDLLSWLPAQSRRLLAAEQREDDSQEREAKRARVARHEELANRHIAAYISEAQRRGEDVSPVDVANGHVGRTVEEILRGAAAEVADRVPRSLREPGPEWLGAAEPVIVSPRSETGRRIFHRARRFQRVLETRRQLAEAERAAQASKHDIGPIEHPAGRRP